MDKKQSILRKFDNPYYFLTIALAVITVSFLLFTPRVASSIFPFKRAMVFDGFLKNTRQVNSIDPQKYWEFREFYSPGYFDFSDKGIDATKVSNALQKLNISPQDISIYFAKFNSKHLISLDGLTKDRALSEVFDKSKAGIKEVLFENSNSIIYKNNQDQTFVVFLLPISEMKKANGFFDYENKDKNLLKDKNWFDITKLDK